MRHQEHELLLKNITTSEFHKRLRNAAAKFSGINAMDSADKYFYGEAPGKFWIDYVPDITMNFDTSGRCPTRLSGNVYVQGADLLVRYTFRKNKSYGLFTIIGIAASGIAGLEGAWIIWLSFYGQGEGVFIGSWFLVGGILFFWMSLGQIRIKKSQKIKLVSFLKESVER